RIRAIVPGDAGAIAVALVTGERDAITEAANESFRVSGLYHVISISGLHMAVLVGTALMLVRGTLALVPGLALRRPIKTWAALTALAIAAFYWVLSGAEVATTRAFFMAGLVLTGILIGRAALSLRTLAAAALAVMAAMPESVLNPGFQMSFSATLALIAFYERWVPNRRFADGGAFFGSDGRCGSAAPDSCWLHWPRASRPRPSPPTISTGFRPTALLPTCWRRR
ncbi:MAG: ComEC/Rec2 family competence protein, partial [Methylacidiphilales bacterium]|nr:ComEC/Rec2 family competence protein [Candidatus Methylacidiphilales bacterium]